MRDLMGSVNLCHPPVADGTPGTHWGGFCSLQSHGSLSSPGLGGPCGCSGGLLHSFLALIETSSALP